MGDVRRVFLAAPYSQFMDPSTGQVEDVWQERLERLRTAFLDAGSAVFNAHHSEVWGQEWRAPEVCTPIDHAAMTSCDVVCALVGTPPSGGVAVELGWASALGKPCLLLVGGDSAPSPLLVGLGGITRVDYADEPASWDDAEVAEVVARTHALAGAAPRPADEVRHPDFCTADECGHRALVPATGAPAALR